MIKNFFFFSFVALVVISNSSARAQQEISTCGETVTSTGILTADLDCPTSHIAVKVASGGTLNLNGFSISGKTDQAQFSTAIWCVGKCKIFGPGTVMRARTGICADEFVQLAELGLDSCESPALTNGRVRVQDVDIVMDGRFNSRGVMAPHARLDNVSITGARLGLSSMRAKVRGATISGNQGSGIAAATVLFLRDSVITGNSGSGATGAKSKIKDSILSDNAEDGFAGNGKVRVKNATFNGNGAYGVSAVEARIRSSTISGNGGTGVRTKVLQARDTTVTGNGEHGVSVNGGKLVLVQSTILGNCVVGTESDCADVNGCEPNLTDTSCNTSSCLESCDLCPNGVGGDLDVCTLD